eukprot:358965-Chlamydomonas_euryale.AAC.2
MDGGGAAAAAAAAPAGRRRRTASVNAAAAAAATSDGLELDAATRAMLAAFATPAEPPALPPVSTPAETPTPARRRSPVAAAPPPRDRGDCGDGGEVGTASAWRGNDPETERDAEAGLAENVRGDSRLAEAVFTLPPSSTAAPTAAPGDSRVWGGSPQTRTEPTLGGKADSGKADAAAPGTKPAAPRGGSGRAAGRSWRQVSMHVCMRVKHPSMHARMHVHMRACMRQRACQRGCTRTCGIDSGPRRSECSLGRCAWMRATASMPTWMYKAEGACCCLSQPYLLQTPATPHTAHTHPIPRTAMLSQIPYIAGVGGAR